MSGLLHNLWHRLGLPYNGTSECWHEGERLMAGFKCSTCGKIFMVHEAGKIMDAMELDLKQHANRIAKRRGESLPYPEVA